MRVLAFTNLFPSSLEPTRGIYNSLILTALAAHCDVRVVCPVAWPNRLQPPWKVGRAVVEQHGGLTVDYPTFVPFARMSPRLNPSLMYQATRCSVARVRRQFPFDAILAVWAYPDAAAALLFARHYGCPLVTSLMGSDVNDLAKRPIIRDVIGDTLSASRGVLALSNAMAQAVKELGVPEANITVQLNGVDQTRFRLQDKQDVRARLGLPTDRPLIVFVGNLVPVKGLDVLVEAFAQLQALTPSNPMVVFVGDGTVRRDLEQRLAQHGLLGSAHFSGRRPHTELPDWVSAADVLCLPSRAEGCPNVVLEALASGRPVVATRVGAVPDLVNEGNGRLVDVESPTALSHALAEVLSAHWQPEVIRSTVARFTWEVVANTFHRVLHQAVTVPAACANACAESEPPNARAPGHS